MSNGYSTYSLLKSNAEIFIKVDEQVYTFPECLCVEVSTEFTNEHLCIENILTFRTNGVMEQSQLPNHLDCISTIKLLEELEKRTEKTY